MNVKKENAIIRQCGGRRVDMEELEQKKRKILEKVEFSKGMEREMQPEENRG